MKYLAIAPEIPSMPPMRNLSLSANLGAGFDDLLRSLITVLLELNRGVSKTISRRTEWFA